MIHETLSVESPKSGKGAAAPFEGPSEGPSEGGGEPYLPSCAPPEENGNYVYMLECRDGSLYTGWTTDIPARLAAHNGGAGAAKGAKCTRSRRPVRLVYYESLGSKSEAMKRETAIKKLTRAKKLELIKCKV